MPTSGEAGVWVEGQFRNRVPPPRFPQTTRGVRRTTAAAPICACCPRGSPSTPAPAPRGCSFRTTARRARQVSRGGAATSLGAHRLLPSGRGSHGLGSKPRGLGKIWALLPDGRPGVPVCKRRSCRMG